MKFTLDENGLEKLLSGSDAERFLMNVGEAVARDWERFDPRNKPGGHEPPKIRVTADRAKGVAVANVSTDDSFWHLIEFGSSNNPPYRPATKAAESNGVKLEDSR